MPSADFCAAVRPPCGDLSLESETQRRSPEVRSTAFPARPPDLPPRSLMTVDFAITCSLVRPGRPRYPVLVHRAAALLRASFRLRLATTPLRFANPSPPSGWIEDFHLQAVVHARHTKGSPGQGNDRGFRTSAGAGTRGLGSRPTVVRCRASSGGGRHVRCDRSPLSDAFALELTASPGPLRTNRERAQEPLRWPKSTIGCGAGTSKTTWPST